MSAKALLVMSILLLLITHVKWQGDDQSSVEASLFDDWDLTIENSLCLYDGQQIITPPPTIDNLIMFLTFDQADTLDQSGNSNHASPSGARGPGYFLSRGYSGHFRGERNTRVAPSETLNRAFAGEFSMSFWIFVNTLGTLTTEQWDFLWKGRQDDTPFEFTIDVASRQLMVTTMTAEEGPITLNSNARIQNQRWTHVALTRSTSLMVLYVNGNLDAVVEVSQGRPTASNPFYIGRMPWQNGIGGGWNIDFFIDELKVWDIVIEESWIEAESGIALGTGTEPHSIELGCINCSFTWASESCTQGYHLWTTIEQYSFAFAAAKTMGWLRAGQRVWSDRATESDSGDLGLALCCRDY